MVEVAFDPAQYKSNLAKQQHLDGVEGYAMPGKT